MHLLRMIPLAAPGSTSALCVVRQTVVAFGWRQLALGELVPGQPSCPTNPDQSDRGQSGNEC